ncbi:hypothetical protein Agub_g13416, partial [Astrephomene gubernaculifera]
MGGWAPNSFQFYPAEELHRRREALPGRAALLELRAGNKLPVFLRTSSGLFRPTTDVLAANGLPARDPAVAAPTPLHAPAPTASTPPPTSPPLHRQHRRRRQPTAGTRAAHCRHPRSPLPAPAQPTAGTRAAHCILLMTT